MELERGRGNGVLEIIVLCVKVSWNFVCLVHFLSKFLVSTILYCINFKSLWKNVGKVILYTKNHLWFEISLRDITIQSWIFQIHIWIFRSVLVHEWEGSPNHVFSSLCQLVTQSSEELLPQVRSPWWREFLLFFLD